MLLIFIFITNTPVSLKDRNVITVPKKFLKNLDEFRRKLNKIWVDQGSEVYNRSMKS